MIKGVNVTLRAPETIDIDLLHIWENDTQMWNVSDVQIPYSRFEIWKYLQEPKKLETDGHWKLMICLQNEPVGMIDFFDYHPVHARVGIGILVYDVKHRNQGIASETIMLALNYLNDHLSIHQVWALVHENNLDSIALFKKCGFSISGTYKDWYKFKNNYINTHIFQYIF